MKVYVFIHVDFTGTTIHSIFKNPKDADDMLRSIKDNDFRIEEHDLIE